MTTLKIVAVNAISNPLVARILRLVTGRRGTILYLHRFADVNGSRRGHCTEILRDTLHVLRSAGVTLVTLDAMLSELSSPSATRSPMVAFTVDDGYRDFVNIGIPIFLEYECPATCFVVPGVIDGTTWFWWDQIDWIQRHANIGTLHIVVDGHSFRLTTGDTDEARHDAVIVSESLKSLPTELLRGAINSFARAANLKFPSVIPNEYAVATWDELREAERLGFSIGAHTMTHPILARCTDEEAEAEISQSINRVSEELSNPAKYFCYPNGSEIDFGSREERFVQKAGLFGAVSTIPAHIMPRVVSTVNRFRLPRFSHEERKGATARIVLFP